jgi:hypothetical protein
MLRALADVLGTYRSRNVNCAGRPEHSGTANMTERVSESGFSRLRHSANAQSRAMTMTHHQFILLSTRGALQAVLVRQP